MILLTLVISVGGIVIAIPKSKKWISETVKHRRFKLAASLSLPAILFGFGVLTPGMMDRFGEMVAHGHNGTQAPCTFLKIFTTCWLAWNYMLSVLFLHNPVVFNRLSPRMFLHAQAMGAAAAAILIITVVLLIASPESPTAEQFFAISSLIYALCVAVMLWIACGKSEIPVALKKAILLDLTLLGLNAILAVLVDDQHFRSHQGFRVGIGLGSCIASTARMWVSAIYDPLESDVEIVPSELKLAYDPLDSAKILESELPGTTS